MSLIELIKQHASEAATAGDYALVASVLNANDVDVVDNTYYTSRYLVTLLGVDTYRIVSGSLAAIGEVDPLVRDIHQTLATTGVDFSTDLTQQMIDQIGAVASWPVEVINQLKAIGRFTRSPAEQYLGAAVTADECQDVWVKSELRDHITNVASNALSKVLSGEIGTLQDLKTYLGG